VTNIVGASKERVGWGGAGADEKKMNQIYQTWNEYGPQMFKRRRKDKAGGGKGACSSDTKRKISASKRGA